MTTAARSLSIPVALLLAACGGQPASETPSRTGDTPTLTAEPASTRAEATSTEGDDAARTYEGRTLSMSFELPDGWTVVQFADAVLLRPENDEGGVFISAITAAIDPEDAAAREVADVAMTTEAVADWLSTHPHLEASEPEEATLGGIDGHMLDVALAVEADADLPDDCEGDPCTVLFWSEEPSDDAQPELLILYEEGPAPYAQNPTWILEHSSGTLIFASAFAHDVDDLEQVLEDAQPVLDSLAFD